MPRYTAEMTYRKQYSFNAKNDKEAAEILDEIHGNIGFLGSEQIEKEYPYDVTVFGDEVESEIEEFKNEDTGEDVPTLEQLEDAA